MNPSHFFREPEFEEVIKICEDRKLTPEKLLEEKIAPFKRKMSNSQGELIGALTRGYDYLEGGCFGGGINYSLKETFYVGIINSETRFPSKGDSFNAFLCGVDKPCSFTLSYSTENEFKEREDKNFYTPWVIDNLRFLYFMEKPPQLPEDAYSYSGGCFGGMICMTHQTEKPRLELYIGNKEATPFLQNQLEGWKYLQLSSLLNYNLPITNEINEKNKKEQLKLFDEISDLEKNLHRLTNTLDKKLDVIKEAGGEVAFSDGACIGLTDSFVETMRYGPEIEDKKRELLGLLNTAIKRNYHEIGIQTERKLDDGIIMQINLKEFFSKRKEQFGL
jgi:hypothetical protein